MVFVFDLLIYQTTPNRTFIDRYTKVDYSSFKVCGFPFNTSITSITQIQDISGPYIKLLGQLCVGLHPQLLELSILIYILTNKFLIVLHNSRIHASQPWLKLNYMLHYLNIENKHGDVLINACRIIADEVPSLHEECSICSVITSTNPPILNHIYAPSGLILNRIIICNIYYDLVV